MRKWWTALLAFGPLAWAAAEWAGPVKGDAPPNADAPWLWVYAPVNFQVDREGDRLVELIRRAGKAGYNAVVVTDTKFGRMGDRPKNYYDNLRRAAKAAEEAGVEIIPMTTSFGYSNDLLQNDPNLAEGIAVRDCPFVVHDGKAVAADDGDMLPMGDFEMFKGDSPAGWDYVDGPGKSTFPDEEVKHGGKRSLRLENFHAGNEGGNARAIKKVAVKPWRQYHVSLWLRTRDVEPVGDLHVAVLAPTATNSTTPTSASTRRRSGRSITSSSTASATTASRFPSACGAVRRAPSGWTTSTCGPSAASTSCGATAAPFA